MIKWLSAIGQESLTHVSNILNGRPKNWYVAVNEMWAGISGHHKSPLKTTNPLSVEVISKMKARGDEEVAGWACALGIREIYSKSL